MIRPPRQIVIGIDGGGTKTRAEAYEMQGGRLGALAASFEAGPCNIAFMPLAEAVASVQTALCGLGCAQEASSVCAAVAGFSFASRRTPFQDAVQALVPGAQASVAPDFAAAFRGALPSGRGILVIAGTGSIAYGGAGDRYHRAGGYGYLIDDAGSGYGVGRAGLAAVLQSMDRTGEATSLSRSVPEALGLTEAGWDGFIEAVYGGSVDRVRIAALAKTVSEAAALDHDAVARRILMRAGGALARLAEAVAKATGCDDPGEPLALVRAGSLWSAGEWLSGVFERSCRRFAPGVEFVEAAHGPAYGAALMAAEAALRHAHP